MKTGSVLDAPARLKYTLLTTWIIVAAQDFCNRVRATTWPWLDREGNMGEFQREHLPDAMSYYTSEGHVLVGTGKWRTTDCKFHGGSDSMRVHMASGAFVCMGECGVKGGDVLAYHMAAHGLSFIDAAKALGAWHEDGRPHKSHRPKPLSASDALQVLGFESSIVAIAAGNLAQGTKLSDDDYARLRVVARRIQHIAEVFA